MEIKDLIKREPQAPVNVAGYLAMNEDGKELLQKTMQAVKQKVDSQKKCDVMNGAIGRVKKIKQGFNIARLDTTEPLRTKTKDINDYYKKAIDKLDEIINEGSNKIEAWDDEQERIHAKEAKRIADANRVKEEEARKREETNRKISLAKNGDGNVKPVEVAPLEEAQAPLSMRRSTQYSHRAKITEITDVKRVPLVILESEAVKEAIRKELQKWLDGVMAKQKGKTKDKTMPELPFAKVEMVRTKVG